jgi:hypothetical protein
MVDTSRPALRFRGVATGGLLLEPEVELGGLPRQPERMIVLESAPPSRAMKRRRLAMVETKGEGEGKRKESKE